MPVRFALDVDELERKHRELAKAVHPDRFAQALPAERREAASKATTVSEAYRALRDPIQRAEAVFRVAGVPTDDASVPKPSPAFLMQVMEQRESLQDAKSSRNEAALLSLVRETDASVLEASGVLKEHLVWNEGADKAHLTSLLPRLSELRYYKRLRDEAERALDEM